MSKHILLCILFFSMFLTSWSQVEKPPVYPGCEEESLQNINSCFNYELKKDLLEEFRVPDIVAEEDYRGKIKILFLVTREGVYIGDEFDEGTNGDQWLKILLVRDSKSCLTFAHGVPPKRG